MSSLIAREGFKVVAGLGKTGLSCVRHYVRRGYQVAVTDSREQPPGLAEIRAQYPEVALHLGGLDMALLCNASEIALSPGLSLKEPAIHAAIDAGVPVVGDIEIFCREVAANGDTPIAAITGSNAKSTVTTLLGLMAERAGVRVLVGGNIGTPALDLLLEPTPELYVLELSSFQLDTTHSLRAASAVVLNVSEDHMDRYAGMQEYMQSKQRIYRGCRAYVFNRDDVLTRPLISDSVPGLGFGLSAPDLTQFGLLRQGQELFLARGVEPWLNVRELKIFGSHNQANALACLAMGTQLGLARDGMLAALREFAGLSHRCQLVHEFNGVRWYNDSKGTNVGATLAAIDGLGQVISGKVVLILGGVGKGQDFRPLAQSVQRYVRAVILIGDDADRIAAALADTGVELMAAGHDFARAMALCAQQAGAGDVALLSPACASFDMFRDYNDRGQQFVALARQVAS